jgi:hypothetical protein
MGVLAPNGMIYFACTANQILKLDTVTETTSLVGSIYSGNNKYEGGVLATNGIYLLPHNASQILKLDP